MRSASERGREGVGGGGPRPHQQRKLRNSQNFRAPGAPWTQREVVVTPHAIHTQAEEVDGYLRQLLSSCRALLA